MTDAEKLSAARIELQTFYTVGNVRLAIDALHRLRDILGVEINQQEPVTVVVDYRLENRPR